MSEPNKMIAPDYYPQPMPEPYRPSNYVLFDFYVGQKVATIYGESGFVEALSMGRSGVPIYLVQTSLDKQDWLHFDQIEDDRWQPYPYLYGEGDAGPLRKTVSDA